MRAANRVPVKDRPFRIPGDRVSFAQAGIQFPAGREQEQITSHAAMNGQDVLLLAPSQVYYQILGAPAHLLDAQFGDLSAKIVGVWMTDGAIPENQRVLNGCSYNRFT